MVLAGCSRCHVYVKCTQCCCRASFCATVWALSCTSFFSRASKCKKCVKVRLILLLQLSCLKCIHALEFWYNRRYCNVYVYICVKQTSSYNLLFDKVFYSWIKPCHHGLVLAASHGLPDLNVMNSHFMFQFMVLHSVVAQLANHGVHWAWLSIPKSCKTWWTLEVCLEGKGY